jgi:4-diphosphocytidyl-2-C-methyl-D-erythritol kinase
MPWAFAQIEIMKLSAPAKINLSLEIKEKRADGFHEIETVMCPITLSDEVSIEKSETGEFAFTCSEPGIPCDDGNLVVRAAKQFFAHTKLAPRVKIHLEKRIPHGAGLGGGSSDAATTLLGLNHLFQTGLEKKALADLAAELGSDVPFFIFQCAAICRGRGEKVSPMDFPHKLPLVLIKPPFGVPTPWAYKRWRDSVELPGVVYAAQQFPWGKLVNDLERPVFEKYIFLALLKRWLLAQPEAQGALMSGSGSTCFAIAHDEPRAVALEQKVRAEFGPEIWTCVSATVSAV